MKDLLNYLVRAKQKKMFSNQEEFRKLILDIQLSDPKLKLDWDDGAGEEWAWFFDQKGQGIYMINSKIGILFVYKNYEERIPSFLKEKYEIVFVPNFHENLWYIDLGELKEKVPEINWIINPNDNNSDCFSLNDFYFETV